MPLPQRDRLREYPLKGVHLALRRLGRAPEQQVARRLAAQAATLPHGRGPRILVLTPRDWAAHVHWEAVIAQALRLRGADVQVLGCGGGLERCDRTTTWEAPPMPCGSCSRYVRDSILAHGLPYTTLAQRWGEGAQTWPELDVMGVDELSAIEYRGLPLGRLVDIPVKWFLLTTRLAEDPLGVRTMRAFLRSARQVVDAMEDALDDIRPDILVILNGMFFFESIAWAAAERRGIDVVNYERGYIVDTLLFGRQEPACFGQLADIWEAFAKVPLRDDEEAELDAYLADRQLGKRAIDRYWQGVRFEDLPRRLPGRRVTLFTNLTWDTAVIGKEIAYPSMQDWIVASIEFFRSRPEHELVIRVHPAETKLSGKPTRESIGDFLGQRYPELPANVTFIAPENPISSYPLMASSDAVSVFTSTTGLEAALAGVPVIVSGQTHYRGKGFTLDVDNPAAYERALDDVLCAPEEHRPDPDLVRRYAHLFFFKLPIAAPGVVEHVQGLVRIDLRSLDELRPGRHPGVDRICDGILHGGRFRPAAPAG